MQPEFLNTPQGRRIAYHKTDGQGPGVVFLGGFKSDMDGTKAIYLEAWAKATGRAFLRFDYSGHGQSSEAFTDGAIGDWAEDAIAAVSTLTEGPQVLVGSSMGGWISLLVCRAIPERVAGFVGIAAAPDFTLEMWDEFTAEQQDEMVRTDQVARPSEYSDEPYIITRRLIEDGKNHQVLNAPLKLSFPVRLLQGTADEDVNTTTALKILNHAEGDDIRLTLVKDADHRFSNAQCLSLIEASVVDILGKGS